MEPRNHWQIIVVGFSFDMVTACMSPKARHIHATFWYLCSGAAAYIRSPSSQMSLSLKKSPAAHWQPCPASPAPLPFEAAHWRGAGPFWRTPSAALQPHEAGGEGGPASQGWMPGRGWAWRGADVGAPCLVSSGCAWEPSPEKMPQP